MNFIEFKNVTKYYKMGEQKIEAAAGINFTANQGEFIIIVGPSGAGKTTVLNMLGGMDSVTGGEIYLDGELISSYSQKNLTQYRRYDVGFVFQFYNLVQNLTALENVELASQICKKPLNPSEVLDMVGLQERKNN
ncbi:MAG: ATP-binding cassette domain-containing protein, partial [Oscillospiraceae bacterium]